MEHQHQSKKYTCPMHPGVIQDTPGNCPICGMTLVLSKTADNKEIEAHHQHGNNQQMGHKRHDHHNMIADFRKRFYVVLVLTIPVMLLSEMIQHVIGINWQF